MNKKMVLKELATTIIDGIEGARAKETSEDRCSEYADMSARLLDLIEIYDDTKFLASKRRYVRHIILRDYDLEAVPKVLSSAVGEASRYAKEHKISFKKAVQELYSDPNRFTFSDSVRVSVQDFFNRFKKETVNSDEGVVAEAV